MWHAVTLLPLVCLFGLTGLPVAYVLAYGIRRRTTLTIRLPLDGLRRLLVTERFAYQLAVLLGAGLTLVDALQIAERTIPTEVRTRVGDTRPYSEAILAGEVLSRLLARSPHIDRLLVELTEIGERTGDLADSMQRAASLMQQRIEAQLETLSRWLEPCLTVVMGGVVGSTVFSVFGPMYQTIGQLGNS